MYIKLPNIFASGTDIHITQGFHGANDNKTGMDFKPFPLISPMAGAKVIFIGGSGGQRYFEVSLPVNGEAIIRAVHGVPTKGVGGTFNKFEVMGYTVPFYNNGVRADHWHIAFRVNKVWRGIMTYINRVYSLHLHGTPWTNPYDQWSFYNDRSLLVNSSRMQDIAPQPSPDNNKPFVPAPEPEPEKEYTEGLPTLPLPEETIPEAPTTPEVNNELDTPSIIDEVEKWKQLAQDFHDRTVELEKENADLKKNKFEIPDRLKSRKFWVTVFGVIYAIVSQFDQSFAEVLNEGLNEVLTVLIAYLGVQGAVDFKKANNDHQSDKKD